MINKMNSDFFKQGFPQNPFSFRGFGIANKMVNNLDKFQDANNVNIQKNPLVNPQQYGQQADTRQQTQGTQPESNFNDRMRAAMMQYYQQRHPTQSVQGMLGAQHQPQPAPPQYEYWRHYYAR